MALPKKLNDADKKLLHDSATDCRAVATELDAYADCASDMQARRARQAILMLRQRLLVLIELEPRKAIPAQRGLRAALTTERTPCVQRNHGLLTSVSRRGGF